MRTEEEEEEGELESVEEKEIPLQISPDPRDATVTNVKSKQEVVLVKFKEEDSPLHIGTDGGYMLKNMEEQSGREDDVGLPCSLVEDLQHPDYGCFHSSDKPSQDITSGHFPLFYSSPRLPPGSPQSLPADPPALMCPGSDRPQISTLPAMFRSPPVISQAESTWPDMRKQTVSSAPRANRRSKIWDHFDSIGKGRMAKCKLCNREVSRGKVLGHLTNAGMNHHMRTHHMPVLLKEEHEVASPLSNARESMSVTTTTSTTSKRAKGHREHGPSVSAASATLHPMPRPSTQAPLQHFAGFHGKGMSRQQSRKVTRLIAEMIAVSGESFSLVEGEPFQHLMQALAPHYQIPSYSTFTRCIVPSLYRSCVGVLKKELGKAAGQSVHFTTDLWGAPSGQYAFLSLMAHWWQPNIHSYMPPGLGTRPATVVGVVDNHGHRCFLLHAEVLDVQHTSEDLLQSLQKMAAQWLGEEAGTMAKMGFVVNNGGGNLSKAIRDGGYVGVHCSAHMIHLVVKAALEEESCTGRLVPLLDSCRTIAGHFQYSTEDGHLVRQEQRNAGLTEDSLKVDEGARWNSTLQMLEQMLEQQKTINAMAHKHCLGIRKPLGKEDWAMIGQLVAVLKPFHAVAEALSQDTASISQVIPLFTHLRNTLDGFLSGRDVLPGGYVADVMALLRSLKDQLARCQKELIDTCPYFMLATMCDPRIKGKLATQSNSLNFWRDRLIDRVLERQKQTIRLQEGGEEEEELEDSPSNPVSPSTSSATSTAQSSVAASFWAEVLDSLVGPTVPRPRKESPAYDIVHAYLSEPIFPHSTNPLQFWDEKRVVWPALAQVAQDLLSCPPTAVQREEVFYISGNILCPQDMQLPPTHLMEQMAFLKVNLPKLGYPALSIKGE